MKILDLSLLPAEAWRPSEPIAGRASTRICERELERIPAWITLLEAENGDGRNLPVTLWDCSAFGFAVMLATGKGENARLKFGDRVRIKFELGADKVSAECIVQNTSFHKNHLRIGLSRSDLNGKLQAPGRNDPDLGAPQGEYLRLPESTDLKAEIRNSILFGEWSSIRLSGIRSGLAFEFITVDGSLPLFVGQELDVHLSLPTSNENHYRGRISRLERLNGDTMRLRMDPVSLSGGLANDLAELLATDCRISPDILKDFGFPLRFFRNRISFGFVESMEDYEKVVQLRRNAYVDAGKKGADTVPEKMSSKWDKLSRILCVYHEGVLVASATMTFPNSEDAILRSQAAFPDSRYPCPTPAKTDLIEVNGLCTHKDYRKGDLLHAVFEHLARAFLFSDRSHILTLADSTLLPLYLKIGFLDLRRECVYLDRRHHLIQLDKRTIQYGRNMPILAWNGIYGDLVADLTSRRFLALSWPLRLLVKIKLGFRPLADRLLGKKMEAVFRNHLRGSDDGNPPPDSNT